MGDALAMALEQALAGQAGGSQSSNDDNQNPDGDGPDGASVGTLPQPDGEVAPEDREHSNSDRLLYPEQVLDDDDWMPKASGKTQACSFIGDAGSTGNRLQMFTSTDMCPDPLYLQLNCGGGEIFPHLYVFAEPSGIARKSVLLTMRQIVALQAGIGLNPDEKFILNPIYDDLRKTPGYLTDCIAYTLINAMASRRDFCSTAKFEIDATAGVRNFQHKLEKDHTESGRSRLTAYKQAIIDIDDRWRKIFSKYKSRGIFFSKFEVLKIEDEATLEAESVRLWSSKMMDSIGKDPFVQSISGIFSMGGKSSQFIRFKSHENIKDGTLLLGYGHKQGMKDFEKGQWTNQERSDNVRAGIQLAFDFAKKEGKVPDLTGQFGTGLWIGVTNIVLAAESRFGLQLNSSSTKSTQSATHDYKNIKNRLAQAMNRFVTKYAANTEIPEDEKKIYIKLLLMDWWFKNIFKDGSLFYFRHEWPLPNGKGCVYSEWPSAEATIDDSDLSRDLGFTSADTSNAKVVGA